MNASGKVIIVNKDNNSDSNETKATLQTINEMLKTYKD